MHIIRKQSPSCLRVCLLAVVIAIATCSVSFQASIAAQDKESYNRSLIEAMYRLDTGYPDKTLAIIHNHLKTNAKDPNLYYLRGRVSLQNRRFDKAIEDFSKSISLNPMHKYAFESRAYCYLQQNKTEQAVADFERVLEIDPLSQELLRPLRTAYIRLGRDKNDHRKLLAKNPLHKAIQLEKAGSNSEAMRIYDDYIAKNPKNFAAFEDRGNLHYYLKNYKKALVDYQTSIALYPMTGRLYFFVANCFRATNDIDKAIANYDMMLLLTPNSLGYMFKYGKVLRDCGKFAKAIPLYDRIIELGEGNADAYRGRGDCYAGLKQYKKAIEDYSNAITMASDPSPDTYRQRALAFEKLGNKEKALRDRNTAKQLSQ